MHGRRGVPTLVHRGLLCVAVRLTWTAGDAERRSRVLYRLWRAERGGHLIEAALVPKRSGRRASRSEWRATWVGDEVDAEALFARLTSPDDPVHPVHLADVVRDALWLSARAQGAARAPAARRRAGEAPQEVAEGATARARREALAGPAV